jgi:hypothetical protein
MSGSSFLIYGLIDPRDGEIRYVGKSSNGLTRPRSHTHPNKLTKDQSPKGIWLRALAKINLQPSIIILDISTKEQLSFDERAWIRRLRERGVVLTNNSSGGEGVGRSQSTRTRSLLANKLRKYWSDPIKRLAASRQRGGQAIRCSNGRVFTSVREAARELNMSNGQINDVLRGRSQQARGLRFTRVIAR